MLLVSIIYFSLHASADGNISTTTGDINIIPASDQIFIDGNLLLNAGKNISMTDLNGNPVGRMYSSISDNRWYLENLADDFVLKARSSPHSTVVFDVNYSAVYFTTPQDYFNFYMITGPAGRHSAFYHQPADDTSQNIILYMGYNDANLPGIAIRADQAHDKILVPWATKEYDLGSATNMWDDCYCQDIYYENQHTLSKGYLGDGEQAYNAVSRIVTMADGEIDHSTIDASLSDDPEHSVSMNAVSFANSKAITYVMENLTARITSLESRVSELELQLAECK